MAAKKSELGRLHQLVTQAFCEGIEKDIEDSVVNPALLSSAAKFLKDNEITADIKEEDDLKTLRQKMTEASEAARNKQGRLLYAVGSPDPVEE